MDDDQILRLVDRMAEHWRKQREAFHLTLGKLISELAIADQDLPVRCENGCIPGSLGSYRGYYDDLAFEPHGNPVTVCQFIKICTEALGKEYEGYKGGQYKMGKDTPLWLSSYGDCSQLAIIGVDVKETEFILNLYRESI